MFINRLFRFCCICALLAGCSGTTNKNDWNVDYDTRATGAPVQLQYGSYSNYGIDTSGKHNISVLLPLSGENASVGHTIQRAIEIAVLQNDQNALSVKFFDTASGSDKAISMALSENPEIIIGPVFANDARKLRDDKDSNIPALSFTSDTDAIGDGVMTVALMPHNSIEAIITEMSSDKVENFIIVAPDTASGHLMAGMAKNVAEDKNMNINGIFFYTESNPDAIKSKMEIASMYKARKNANTHAREILSDILTNETLTSVEKSSIRTQLDKFGKHETLGDLPYTAVLFLGNADDTKSLASFLKYFDSGSVRFYGTALWDGTDITSDFTMSGAKYAALPESNPNFNETYSKVTGKNANRLATFGYDAMKIATSMLYSPQSNASYLLSPSGFYGIDGLIRFTKNGDNERGMQIMQLNASGTARVVKTAPVNFIKKIYDTDIDDIRPVTEQDFESTYIDINKYIYIPERFSYKYGANGRTAKSIAPQTMSVITPVASDTNAAIIDSNFKPVKRESIKQTYIDSVEING